MLEIKRYFPRGALYAGLGRCSLFVFFKKKNMTLPSAFWHMEKGMKTMQVNQKELAHYLGISTRRIRDLRAEGLFKRAAGKVAGYDLAECIQEYISYKVKAEAGRRAYVSKEEVQIKHEEVKRKISILKLRRMRRELHEAADVEEFLAEMLLRFRNRLLAVSPRVAMKVSGETDMSRLTDIIQQEMLLTLEELSEYDADEIDKSDLRELDDDDIEDIEDDEDNLEDYLV